MVVPSKQDIIDFVRTTYGQEVTNRLKNIHQGGLSNQKGRDYENQFLLYKTFEIANKYPHDCANQIIASQTIGFVDDICHIDYEENTKYNFQAKNSSGEAAKWTEDLADRFRKQREVDATVFNVATTKNCLLVSDKTRALENISMMPSDLKDKDNSEYFKYYPNIYELVQNTDLNQYVTSLIGSCASDQCDYAVTLINGSLQSGKHVTVKDIFRQAESNAHPNPFIKFRTSTHRLPNWVQQILTKNSHCVVYSLDYDKLTLNVKGINVSCYVKQLAELEAPTTNKVNDIKDLVSLMMSIMGKDIKRHLESSKSGEVL